MLDALGKLPPLERAKAYLGLADEADRYAASASGEDVRQSYRIMAQQWRQLAEQTEKHAGKLGPR
jgi:hypothetical protein